MPVNFRQHLVRGAVVGATTVATTSAILALPPSANADVAGQAHHVYNTAGEGLWLHPDSAAIDSSVSDLMPDGTEFDITCWSYGDDVLGDAVWDFGTDVATGNAGFATDYYLDTNVTQGHEAEQLSDQGVPECGDSSGASTGATSTQAI